MEIRDNRDKEWFWLDNQYLNGYAKHLGAICTVVYISLCRHSHNKDQTCFPSMELIAEENGISEKSVSRCIKTLKEWNIISVKEIYDKKNKRRKNNVYTLLSKKEWIKKPQDSQSGGNSESHQTHSPDPADSQSESHQTPVPSNNTHINNTQLTTAATSAAEVSAIIELFKEINPEYIEWYKNTTQRKATAQLIEKYGYQKVSNMVTQLPSIISKKYAPKITSPFELKRDLGKLLLFIKQESPKTSKIVKL